MTDTDTDLILRLRELGGRLPELSPAAGLLDRVYRGRARRRRAAAAVAACVAVAVTAGGLRLAGLSSPGQQLSAGGTGTITYGQGTSRPLAIQPVPVGIAPAISERTARAEILAELGPTGSGRHLVFFGWAKVTAPGASITTPGHAPHYTGQAAWIAVYEQALQVFCPLERLPTRSPAAPRTVPKNYEAVIVNPSTGQVVSWEQEITNSELRLLCPGIP